MSGIGHGGGSIGRVHDGRFRMVANGWWEMFVCVNLFDPEVELV